MLTLDRLPEVSKQSKVRNNNKRLREKNIVSMQVTLGRDWDLSWNPRTLPFYSGE